MPLNFAEKHKLHFSSDFGDPQEVIKEIVETRHLDLEYDERNRNAGIEDSKYAANFQWPQADWNWRRSQKIPALQFNRVPVLLRKRLSNRAKTRVGPKLMPTAVASLHGNVAYVREGLIRNIERTSDIATVDGIVSQNQLIAGIGNYSVTIEETYGDIFNNDIMIRTDPNPFSVIWSRYSVEPTGRDAPNAMEESEIDRKQFERLYPDASLDGFGTESGLGHGALVNSVGASASRWVTKESVRVGKFWRVVEEDAVLALMDNGDVVDITGQDPRTFIIPRGDGEVPWQVARDPNREGELLVQSTKVKKAECIVTNGADILAEPVRIPVDRVPLVRVPGWLVHVDNYVYRFGAVSFVKDALTFHNYVRSDRIERIVYRPRANWRANNEEVAGYEDDWTNSHTLRGGVLKHNGPPGGGPALIDPPRVDQAAVLESEAALRDINDLMDSGPDLSGEPANSNVALETQMDASNNGDYLYSELYKAAKREVYRICDQLIPYVYDTPRIVSIVGNDNKVQEAVLNDPENPESIDITLGKYKVSIDTGPSETTQRTHFIRMLETMYNADPERMGVVADKIVELYNFPGGEQLADRIRQRLGIQDEPTEEEIAKQEKQAELEQLRIEIELELARLEVEKKRAEIQKTYADADSKVATTDSELAQADERRAAAQQRVSEGAAKVEEIYARIDLLMEQRRKLVIDAAIARTQPKEQSNA